MAASLVGQASAAGGEEQALLERLKKLYPSSEITAVSKTPLPGMFEVTMGSQLAYVGKEGRYFVFGRLVDLQNQADPGAARPVGASQRIDVAELPLRDAIVQVNGTGVRKLFVFLDPKCPGCDQLEADLSHLPDTTVYTFLAPALDPDSREAARKQWIVHMPVRAL
ncbi:MAG TPA: DsbC family protein, partial [Burkholderiaceae bacterium]|nr:DsbC family protein [Burkholderiaceae bacterium]